MIQKEQEALDHIPQSLWNLGITGLKCMMMDTLTEATGVQLQDNRRSCACPGPDQPKVEDNIDENICDNPVEVGELAIQTDAADNGELEDLPDASLNYFIFHFIDETDIDDK